MDQVTTRVSPLSSRDYLEQMRERRQQKTVINTPQVQPAQPRPEQTVFQNKPQPSEPTSPYNDQPTNDDLFPGQISPQFGQESELIPGQYKPIPEEEIFAWTAPSRPFKKRNRQFYVTVAVITLLISLILFFAGQFLPIAVVVAVAFLAYVLSSVEPDNVVNKITTYGLRTEDKIYYWEEMFRFWYETKYDREVLMIEVAVFPGRLTFLFADKDKEFLTAVLSEVLLQERPKDTTMDKMAKWLTEKIPLEG